MTTLRVILDQMLAPVPGGIGRYTRELTKELIATAPPGCNVAGIVSNHAAETYKRLQNKLPGLSELDALPFGRRFLSSAWQYGFATNVGGGLIHAPSLFSPLRDHEPIRSGGEQVVTTIHDAVPWTHPETLTKHGASWHRAMAKRAFRFADAVTVPTHAVARQLSKFYDFGDRLRVISGAVSPHLQLASDADERAKKLKLPSEYLLAVGTLEPRKGIQALIESLKLPNVPDIPLLIVGPAGWGQIDIASLVEQNELPAERVRSLGFLSDKDLAVAYDRASAFVFPSLAEGFGLPVLEAFSFGTPVIHSDDPALIEVADNSGFIVDRSPRERYAEQLGLAITTVLGDAELRTQLAERGRTRARAFTWKQSAESVWQLHADL